MIDFYLNGESQHCTVTSPDTSVLELLRTRLGKNGTKEGCASGDCGACTVAIGEPDANGELRYHAANSCITPAHQLDGCHLVTAEGLARGDALHPAQAAMVECHGSQCGFCTPGIVMSLFTLYEEQRHQPAPLTQHRLEEVLGGNLCRCTGYRPIRDAALSMANHPETRPLWADNPELAGNVAQLRQAKTHSTSNTSHTTTRYYQAPRDLAALCELKGRHPKARLVAGATDLWLETTQRLTPLDELIDVRQVAELKTIEATTDGWWVGAAVTYSELEPLLAEHFPAFAHLLQRFASKQIRNRGTLGGNIANASPIGDSPPVLLALGAQLMLDSPDGARELPLSDFFLGYKQTALADNEFIRAIFLPRLPQGQNLKVWKLSKRREDDISALLGAFAWRLDAGVMRDVRLAFGGMAAIPKRAAAAEAALEGQAPGATAFMAARRALLDDFQPLSDVRGSAEYRQVAAGNLLERLRLMIEAESTDQTPNNKSTPEVTLHAYAH